MNRLCRNPTSISSGKFVSSAEIIRQAKAELASIRHLTEPYRTQHRTKARRPWKWLCWTASTNLPYELRYFFSRYCDLWFVDSAKKNNGRKLQPSIKNLRAKTGFRQDRVKTYIQQLRDLDLLDGDRPIFNISYLMPKRNFNPDKWWKCTTGRPIEPSENDLQDILYSFIQYQNDNPKRYATTAYLAKCTGMTLRRIRRAIEKMVASNRVTRNSQSNRLTALIQYQGDTYEYPKYKDTRIIEILDTLKCSNTERTLFIATARKRFSLAIRYFEGAKGKITYSGIMKVIGRGVEPLTAKGGTIDRGVEPLTVEGGTNDRRGWNH